MLFQRGYNFGFPWLLIFAGAVFRVYLKSRFLFKVKVFLWLLEFRQSLVVT